MGPHPISRAFVREQMERARSDPLWGGAGLNWRNRTILSPMPLPLQRCPLKPPAQTRWASGRVDLSNKTYEAIATLGPAAPQSESEACPPPLPVKNPSRTMVQGRVGHTSGGMTGCPEKCSSYHSLSPAH